MTDKIKLFEQKGIYKSILILGLPLILSQIVNVLYNIVDRIFIANMPVVGPDALAGVSISFPIIILISSFAALFGLGAAPLAAIKLGEGKNKEATKIMMQSFVSLLVVGLFLTITILLFNEQLLSLFGITEELLKYGKDYLTIYVFGSIFVMISVGFSAFITIQGHSLIAALIVLVGALINIALDPILIYTFNMGVKGAAIATLISQGISAILVVSFLLSKKSSLKLSLKGFKFNYKIILSIMALGISPFIMQSTEALIQIVFNNQIVKYGGSNYVIYLNIMAVMLSLLQFMILPVNGLSQGASSIISYNYGKGNIKRVKEAYKSLTVISLAYSLIFYLIIFIFPKELVSIFNKDTTLLNIAPKTMRIFFFGMAFFGAQLSTQASFMALGQAVVSLTMALLRKVVILIPLAYILPSFLGIEGIFYSELIADLLATTITFTTFMFLVNGILNKRLEMLNNLNDKTSF